MDPALREMEGKILAFLAGEELDVGSVGIQTGTDWYPVGASCGIGVVDGDAGDITIKCFECVVNWYLK